MVISSTQLATKDFISRPYVIKPINEGSSIGIHFVHNKGDDRILDYPYDGNVMLEEFIGIGGFEFSLTLEALSIFGSWKAK